MGMSMSVYVGPYLKVEVPDDKIDDLLDEFQDLVQDGRGESGENDADLYLIPNQDLPGVSRPMSFDRHEGDYKPIEFRSITEHVEECEAFTELVCPLLQELRENGFEFRECWGVVTGWF